MRGKKAGSTGAFDLSGHQIPAPPVGFLSSVGEPQHTFTHLLLGLSRDTLEVSETQSLRSRPIMRLRLLKSGTDPATGGLTRPSNWIACHWEMEDLGLAIRIR